MEKASERAFRSVVVAALLTDVGQDWLENQPGLLDRCLLMVVRIPYTACFIGNQNVGRHK